MFSLTITITLKKRFELLEEKKNIYKKLNGNVS